MKSHKLKASNTTDHYLIDSPVTENDILIMAQKLARQSLAKGRLLTSPGQVFSHLKKLLQSYEHEVFALCYSITNTGYSAFISCFAVLWMKPVSIHGRSSSSPWRTMRRSPALQIASWRMCERCTQPSRHPNAGPYRRRFGRLRVTGGTSLSINNIL